MSVLDVVYSATIPHGDRTHTEVKTMFFGGTWTWYAHHVSSDNGALLGEIEADPAMFWLTSQDALDAGLVVVMQGEDKEQPGMFGEGYGDYYTGETVPTGWDAQDHKALYE